MKIHLVQAKPKIGDIDYNLNIIFREIKNGFNNNASLICFPELFLTGYPMEDRLLVKNLKHDIKKAISQVINLSIKYNTTIALPTPFFGSNKIFNAILLIKNGEIITKIKKQHLPNYGVFDEKRYFHKGISIEVINIANTKIVFAICEDIWNQSYIHKVNKLNIDLLIAINASPFEKEKHKTRITKLSQFNCNSIYLNQVLGYDEIIFDGSSFGLSKNQKILFQMKSFEEECLTYEKDKIYANNQNYQSSISLTYKALVFGLQEYCKQNNVKSIVLGLSGGIDSALCTKIAIDALGAENILTVMLPSQISSNQNKKDALYFAKINQVKCIEIPIQNSFNSIKNILNFKTSNLTEQNLQSRIRGTILMAISNQTNKMLITTGNKSEIATGYCTIYGDMNGGFNPIKDLFKTEVYQICHFLNTRQTIIPINIIKKVPTAELTLNQSDEISLGMPYQTLDFILQKIIEEREDTITISKNLENNNIFKECLQFQVKNNITQLNTRDLVYKVMEMIKKSEFKRNQSAPGTKISKSAFGRDWRFGINI